MTGGRFFVMVWRPFEATEAWMECKLPVLLMVEDEEMLVKAVRRCLHGVAEVHAVESCKDALAAAAERHGEIRAVLLDWTLVGETTDAAIPKLRERFGPGFPIYGWSGLKEGQARQRALGCTDSFDKLDSMQVINRLRAHFQDA